MNLPTYQYLYNDAITALQQHHLQQALQSLQGMASTLKSWNVKDEIDTLVDSYHILLNYMARGANDPERKKMYKGFVRRAYELSDVLNRIGTLTLDESFYATSWRTLQNIKGTNFSLSDVLSNDCDLRDQFDAIWLSSLWTADDEKAFFEQFNKVTTNENARCLMLSAVTLSAVQFFDAAKYRVLLDNAANVNVKVRVRALTGLFYVHIFNAEKVLLYPDIEARLHLLCDQPNFIRELELLQKQLFLSLETKQIEHNLQEEIIPKMMEHMKNLNVDRSIGLDELNKQLTEMDENPDWNISATPLDINDPKLMDYMHEFTKLQQRGADMYMGSFKMMKQQFSFFNVLCNWFWPFTLNHSAVPQAARDSALIKTLIGNAQMCDSDKYSLCLMVEKMNLHKAAVPLPEEFMKNSSQLDGERLDDIDTEEAFKNELRSYVQGTYRFYNLFNHRSAFSNPFQHNLFIADSAPFDHLLNDDSFLLRMAFFVFNDKSYVQALNMFTRLSDNAKTAEVLQKQGFCCEQLQQYEQAISCYEQANQTRPGSIWTLRRLATCCRAIANYTKALNCYDELAKLEPENVNTALRQAECLIHLKQYDEAFKYLFKVNYLSPDSGLSERAIAWCSLLTDKYEQAENYYNKVLQNNPTPTDYLNAGHAAWLLGNVAEAVARYRKAMTKENANSLFENDRTLLKEKGISDDDMAMMNDAVQI